MGGGGGGGMDANMYHPSAVGQMGAMRPQLSAAQQFGAPLAMGLQQQQQQQQQQGGLQMQGLMPVATGAPQMAQMGGMQQLFGDASNAQLQVHGGAYQHAMQQVRVLHAWVQKRVAGVACVQRRAACLAHACAVLTRTRVRCLPGTCMR